MTSRDEFGDLSNSFNYMTQALWKNSIMQKSFGRYVSPEVVDMIMANPEESWLKGKRSEATILFSDIRGFTAYSEGREPEEVVEALNEYFGIATEFILEYGGYVDKFIGDAIMATFVDANDAVLASEKILNELSKLNKNREKSGKEKISLHIGVNSGTVIQAEIGTSERKDLTVLGDTVNIAAHIQQFAHPDSIFISESTFSRLKDSSKFTFYEKLAVKGRNESISVFKSTIV